MGPYNLGAPRWQAPDGRHDDEHETCVQRHGQYLHHIKLATQLFEQFHPGSPIHTALLCAETTGQRMAAK